MRCTAASVAVNALTAEPSALTQSISAHCSSPRADGVALIELGGSYKLRELGKERRHN
jgi:hypothetical protein